MKSTLALGITRREFLRGSAAAVAGFALAPGLARAADVATGRKIPFAVQLYSLREECKTDLPGMLAAVAKIGYKGVEFAGYHGFKAVELRKLLDENGLVACGSHTQYDTVLGDKLKETIEFNHVIGNKFLIVPWLVGLSKQGWLDLAKRFNGIADELKPEGMWVGYHAHEHDFQKLDGEYPWDIFFGNTKTEVIMQLDTGNCRTGGADPVTVLREYPGRARTIHIKAYGGGPEAVIGEDKINWPPIFAFCESKGGTDWFVLEHETSVDPLNAVKRSFEALKKMGKV
jgi:sugar phosphate isomerase/epimerase